MRVRYNSEAANNLDEILAYLSERNPQAAHYMLMRLESAIQRIGQNPNIGVALRQNFRRIVVGKYLIVYTVAADAVTIEYIRHGARRQPWENN
jgi:addiction module RelE/StbE family toxin